MRRAMTWAALALFLSGCATGPMTQEQRDSSDRTIKALEILNAYANGRRAPQPISQPSAPTAYFKSSYISGANRICIYDRLGSQYVVTMRSVDICPLTQ